jgi:hypothetical protein
VGDVARKTIDQSGGDNTGVEGEWYELGGGAAMLGGDALWGVGK